MLSSTAEHVPADATTPSIQDTGTSETATHPTVEFQSGWSDPLLHYGEYPELAAGVQDWAFQGVDLAFFESLINSAENDSFQDANPDVNGKGR